jgi:hypothetical protein
MAEKKGLIGEVEWAPDMVRDRAHQRYLAASAARDAALDTAYDAYRDGTGSWEPVMEHLWTIIRAKSATQPNLRYHQRTADRKARTVVMGDDWDIAQDVLIELTPPLSDRKVKGKASHYINTAFRLHSIDAKHAWDQEQDWKQFLLDHGAKMDGHGGLVSNRELAEAEFEANSEIKIDDKAGDAFAEPLPPQSNPEEERFSRFGPRPSRLPFSSYLPDGGNGASIRAAMRGTDAFVNALRSRVYERTEHRTRAEREERDGLALLECLMPHNSEPRDQKECAQRLGWSESKVSRMYAKLEIAIRRVVDFYAAAEEENGWRK